MIHSHLLALVLFAGLVAAVLATLARDERRERWRLGARIFLLLVLSVVVSSWLMRWLLD